MKTEPRYEVTVRKGKPQGFYSLTAARLFASRYLPGYVSLFDTKHQTYLHLENADHHLGQAVDIIGVDPLDVLAKTLSPETRRELSKIRERIAALRSARYSLDDAVREARREWLESFLFRHPITFQAA